jgi:predicted lipoprotein with Yx(FWY)xxD motif
MNLIRTSGRIAAAAALVIAAAGCSEETPSTTTSPESAPTSAAATSAPATSPAASPAEGALKVADSSLGQIIVDGSGMTVYYFTKDQANSGKSACSGDCLTAWPAVVATSDQPSGEGITAELGTITRDDGTKQVTVNGMPIYLFAKDKAAGDVTGQGVGKVWYVVAPDGKMITEAAGGSGG